MWKKHFLLVLVIIFVVLVGLFIYKSEPRLSGEFERSSFLDKPFMLGLDLSSGTQLVYSADVKNLPEGDVSGAMNSLREIIENRVNSFGVSEAVVRTQKATFSNNNENRLIIELPGVTDISQAVELIGQTPTLEFKTEKSKDEPTAVTISPDGQVVLDISNNYVSTGLDGRYLKRADVIFDPMTNLPTVSISWNDEGSKLFADITRENVGKTIAIFLDGNIISAPVVNEAITGGQAIISGSSSTVEARDLARRLNSGALPVPIELISTSNIGATLGDEATKAGVLAGIIGLLAICICMILWYRLPGVVASINLIIYAMLMLFVFKIWPVTLTAAGIAGFIISIGIAVDANILVFERMKEEIQKGGSIKNTLSFSFKKAWNSVRDSNLSSIITALILYIFGTTLIKSFAFTFFIGAIISLTIAYSLSKIFFNSIPVGKEGKFVRFLFGSGFRNANLKN